MGKEAGKMSQIVLAQRGGKTLEMMQELKRKYAAVETENEQLRKTNAELAKEIEQLRNPVEMRWALQLIADVKVENNSEFHVNQLKNIVSVAKKALGGGESERV